MVVVENACRMSMWSLFYFVVTCGFCVHVLDVPCDLLLMVVVNVVDGKRLQNM